MQPSRRTLVLALAQTRGIGGKTITRILTRLALSSESTAQFLALSAESLQEEFKIPQKTAIRWTENCHSLIAQAEKELARLDGLGVRIATAADPHYPRRLDEFDVSAPGLVYLYGNLALLERETVSVVSSRNPPFGTLDLMERAAEQHVMAGKVLVSSHDTEPYQRAAVVPLRWGAPRIMVLDSGLFDCLGPELRDEPFAAARLWRFQFDPRTDLAISAVSPRSGYHQNSNRIRDQIVFGLSLQVDIAWCAPGGNMESLAKLALKAGRKVRLNRICPNFAEFEKIGACELESP